jgi:hypothetical protein
MNDDELREQLAGHAQTAFQGILYRATLPGRDPLTSSYRGGRWVPPDTKAVLYTSTSRSGALAEIAFRLGLNTPIPKISIRVHSLSVSTAGVLALSMENLQKLDVDPSRFGQLDYDWTQKIGLAAFQIGATALQIPSARWPTDNLVIVDESVSNTTVDLLESEVVNWIEWAHQYAPQFLPDR